MVICYIEVFILKCLGFLFIIRLDLLEMLFLSAPSIFSSVTYQVKNTCGFRCGVFFLQAFCLGIQWGLAFLPQITENTEK